MSKIFKIGVCSGRYQHIHKIHEHMINCALNLCEKVIVFIGEPDESNTKKNPFSYSERKNFIEIIYQDQTKNNLLEVHRLEDIRPITLWAKHMVKNVKDITGNSPDSIFYGHEKKFVKWYDEEDMNGISEIIFSEELYIDGITKVIRGTEVRNFIINNQKNEWESRVNKLLHPFYNQIQKRIIDVQKT
jgi:nicotinamide-nucleotide adenylyltransferase